MSSLPPPNVPSAVPPPPPGPAPLPAPSTSTPTPPRRTGLIIGAVVVVLAAVGVGVFLLTKDDDASDSLSTDALLVAITDITGRAAAEPDDSVMLDTCPAGDLGLLAAKAPTQIRQVVETANEPSAFVYQPDLAGEPPLINCTLDDESFVSGIGLGFGVAVQPFREDLIRVLSEYDVTFDGERAHLGGTVLQFCAEPKDPQGSFRAFCEADWFDDEVWVGVFVASDTKSSAMADEWLVAILPEVVTRIVADAPTIVTETTS